MRNYLTVFSVPVGLMLLNSVAFGAEQIDQFRTWCDAEINEKVLARSCDNLIRSLVREARNLRLDARYAAATDALAEAEQVKSKTCVQDGRRLANICTDPIDIIASEKSHQASQKSTPTRADNEAKKYVNDCHNDELPPKSDQRAGGCNFGAHTYLNKAQILGSRLRNKSSPEVIGLYKKALVLFSEGCKLMGGGEDQHTCQMKKETEDAIFGLEFPELAKERIAMEKAEKRKFVQALRNYLNEDCSRVRLITKAGDSTAASTTAATSHFSEENGYCVANNGLAKISIGVGSIYDHRCTISSAKEEKMCDFGVIPHCRLSSEFGNLTDNELVSKSTCSLLFPANYVASALFSTVDDKYVAQSFSFRSCPLNKKPTECFTQR